MSSVWRTETRQEQEDRLLDDMERKLTLLDSHARRVEHCLVTIKSIKSELSTAQGMVTRLRRELKEIDEEINNLPD